VVTPYLICADAARAIAFYKEAFGASERMRLGAPGGRIGHAEITIGDCAIMLADEHPEMGARAPRSYGGSPVSLVLYVENVDATVERATLAGAKLQRAVEDKFYGDRMGSIVDPDGHIWHVATHIEDVAPEELQRRAELAAKAAGGG
jgi:PhnB protein